MTANSVARSPRRISSAGWTSKTYICPTESVLSNNPKSCRLTLQGRESDFTAQLLTIYHFLAPQTIDGKRGVQKTGISRKQKLFRTLTNNIKLFSSE